MSAYAQKFKIFEKKLSLGVRSPWSLVYLKLLQSLEIQQLNINYDPSVKSWQTNNF